MQLPAAPTSPWPLRSLALALVLSAMWCSVAGAAGSITALDVDELIQSRTATVRVSGVVPADRDPSDLRLHVMANPMSAACGASWGDNVLRSIDRYGADVPAAGPFTGIALQLTLHSPGDVLICAYLEDVIADVVLGTHEVVRTVRPPRTSLSLALPDTRFEPGEVTALTVTSTTEVRRHATVGLLDFASACPTTFRGANYAAFSSYEIPEGQHLADQRLPLPTRVGHYRTCGFVGYDLTDLAPTTAVEGPSFWIGPEPRCRITRVTRRAAGALRVRCSSNVSGAVTAQTRRQTVSFDVTNGVGHVQAKRLALSGRRARPVTFRQGSTSLGTRLVRLR